MKKARLLPAAPHCAALRAAGLLVCCVPLVLRLAAASNPPSTDEGYYALHAMLAHQHLTAGEGLPPYGPLHLYPLLCSFVFSWNINHLIALRICDLAVSLVLARQWFRLLEEESGSLPLGLGLAVLCVFAFNQPLFVQHGFKNSLSISFVFLLTALRLGLKADSPSPGLFIRCGALTALAVLFREALAPFAVLGAIGAAAAHGRRAAFGYLAGGLGLASVLLFFLAAARGGFGTLVDAYATFFAMAREAGRFTANIFFGFPLSLEAIAFLAPVGAALLVGLVLCAIRGKRSMPHMPRLLFWAALALAPLPEILSKDGYAYHYATCLFGLSGLAACCLRVWREVRPRPTLAVGVAALAAAALLAVPQAWSPARRLPAALRALAVMLPSTRWPEDMTERSNYLLMARAVREAATPGDTLLVSGCYFVLHPLTGLLPPRLANHQFDPGLLALAKGLSPEDLRVELEKERPDILVLSHRAGLGTDTVARSLALMPEYAKTADIPLDPGKDYGAFSASVLARRKSASPAAPPVSTLEEGR
jgi:hypothetical protein